MRTPYFALSFILALWMPSPANAAPQKWQDKMKELAGVMEQLLPALAEKNPDMTKLRKNADKLAKLSHGVRQGANGQSATAFPPDADPSLRYISTLFERDTKRAAWALHEGNQEYAKGLLRTVTAYCIACHTRHDRGPDFPVFPLDPKVSSLGKMEKANLFAATRQFDKAFAEYQGLVASPEFQKKDFLEWERALRHGLEISVRVKKDPKLSMTLVDQALALETPDYVRAYVTKWKTEIEKWQKEPVKVDKNDGRLLSEANRLMQEARVAQQFPADHSGDISYLRASAVAHEVLGVVPEGPTAAEALFITGSAYEVLNSTVISPLHEMCFEACIRTSPHTPMARQCYQRYESSIYFGYSGSGGTHIPFDVEKIMHELKGLSQASGKTGR